jgi:hypothetical protein
MSLEGKNVVSFTENINAETFLREMTTAEYSEENLKFAEALEVAFTEGHKIELSEEARIELLEKVELMEQQIAALKDVCALEEGFGFMSWWRLNAHGGDDKLIATVRTKLSQIKTQEKKDELLKDLKEAKERAIAIKGKYNKEDHGEFWKNFWVRFKANQASALFGGVIAQMIKNQRDKDGTNAKFIEGLGALIKDVEAVKIQKEQPKKDAEPEKEEK